ncbi:MAG TPA: hypothetical protein VNS09_16125 [Solirubrobacter sp.]|nr:hypothetical protein [Solirubrobacter sp.]
MTASGEGRVTITVKHHHAKIVVGHLKRNWMLLPVEGQDVFTPESFAASLANLKRFAKWLDKLNWGWPAGDVKIKMTAYEAHCLATELLEIDVVGLVDDAAERRHALSVFTVGMDIADQIEDDDGYVQVSVCAGCQTEREITAAWPDFPPAAG